ncbi:MAG TPA: TadE/TadG family type IV pilus assembly protein [Candidatus Limnocylindrales bacterium]|nr:TadE/TadG family type IV pilus assembly protein [Candidatus Limnocylindrales bacterium]
MTPKRRRERGQTLVEFALVTPLIVFMVVAFIDMGRAVWTYTTITNAARQGARVAAVNQLTTSADCDESIPITDPTTPHWTIYGCAIAAGGPLGLTTSNVGVSYAAPPGTTVSCSPSVNVGCIASVTITYAYSPSTPILNGFIHSMTFTSTSQEPVERVFP